MRASGIALVFSVLLAAAPAFAGKPDAVRTPGDKARGSKAAKGGGGGPPHAEAGDRGRHRGGSFSPTQRSAFLD